MEAFEVLLWIEVILIALFVCLNLHEDYKEVRRRELAQREVRRRHDQVLATARERARLAEESEPDR